MLRNTTQPKRHLPIYAVSFFDLMTRAEQALGVITRSYLSSIENELDRILHEQEVRAAELAYAEEKRKRS